MRLRLGRQLVNLLPLAQQTKTFTNGVDGRSWVVGREFESHVHHEDRVLKKSEFPHDKCQESEKHFWIPRNCNRVWWRVDPQNSGPFQGGRVL